MKLRDVWDIRLRRIRCYTTDLPYRIATSGPLEALLSWSAEDKERSFAVDDFSNTRAFMVTMTIQERIAFSYK